MSLFKNYQHRNSEKILIGVSEGFPSVYANLKKDEIEECRQLVKNGSLRCKICNTEMMIAAFGKRIKNGGDYKRDPFFRAKISHATGMICKTKTKKNSKTNVSSIRHQKSMENALNSLIDLSNNAQENKKQVKVKNTKTPYNNIGGGTGEYNTQSIRQIRFLPNMVSKVKGDRTYKLVEELWINTWKTDSQKVTSVFLNGLCGGELSLKISTRVEKYEELLALAQEDKKYNIAIVFYVESLEDSHAPNIKKNIWINDDDWIQFKILK